MSLLCSLASKPREIKWNKYKNGDSLWAETLQRKFTEKKMAKRLPASSLGNESGKSTSSRLVFVMFAPPPNGQIQHGQIPPSCPASLTGSGCKPTTCCPSYLFQDHQARNDRVSMVCSFFHVTEDGSKLPTAHASHKNAHNVQLFARTCSEMALTHCSLEIKEGLGPFLFPKHLSGLTAMADLEGASETLEESKTLPLPARVCGNPRMPSSGLAPKMSLQLRARSCTVGWERGMISQGC